MLLFKMTIVKYYARISYADMVLKCIHHFFNIIVLGPRISGGHRQISLVSQGVHQNNLTRGDVLKYNLTSPLLRHSPPAFRKFSVYTVFSRI